MLAATIIFFEDTSCYRYVYQIDTTELHLTLFVDLNISISNGKAFFILNIYVFYLFIYIFAGNHNGMHKHEEKGDERISNNSLIKWFQPMSKTTNVENIDVQKKKKRNKEDRVQKAKREVDFAMLQARDKEAKWRKLESQPHNADKIKSPLEIHSKKIKKKGSFLDKFVEWKGYRDISGTHTDDHVSASMKHRTQDEIDGEASPVKVSGTEMQIDQRQPRLTELPHNDAKNKSPTPINSDASSVVNANSSKTIFEKGYEDSVEIDRTQGIESVAFTPGLHNENADDRSSFASEELEDNHLR